MADPPPAALPDYYQTADAVFSSLWRILEPFDCAEFPDQCFALAASGTRSCRRWAVIPHRRNNAPDAELGSCRGEPLSAVARHAFHVWMKCAALADPVLSSNEGEAVDDLLQMHDLTRNEFSHSQSDHIDGTIDVSDDPSRRQRSRGGRPQTQTRGKRAHPRAAGARPLRPYQAEMDRTVIRVPHGRYRRSHYFPIVGDVSPRTR